jgi:hypothetical protein
MKARGYEVPLILNLRGEQLASCKHCSFSYRKTPPVDIELEDGHSRVILDTVTEKNLNGIYQAQNTIYHITRPSLQQLSYHGFLCHPLSTYKLLLN